MAQAQRAQVRAAPCTAAPTPAVVSAMVLIGERSARAGEQRAHNLYRKGIRNASFARRTVQRRSRQQLGAAPEPVARRQRHQRSEQAAQQRHADHQAALQRGQRVPVGAAALGAGEGQQHAAGGANVVPAGCTGSE